MILFWSAADTYGEFSNWYLCKIVNSEGIEFCSSEQIFMYEKAKLFGDDIIAKEILKTNHQGDIKKLGRMVSNFNETIWNEHKYNIMLEANRLKFMQNPDLLDLLLFTGTEEIAEASPYDKVWGIGLSPNNPKAQSKDFWLGENLLGKVLMQLRKELSNV